MDIKGWQKKDTVKKPLQKKLVKIIDFTKKIRYFCKYGKQLL
jgi:hypothetical protein